MLGFLDDDTGCAGSVGSMNVVGLTKSAKSAKHLRGLNQDLKPIG